MATIIALSSGLGRAGVAVVRLSGPAVRFVCETLCGRLPAARVATLVTVRDPATSETLDRCLALRFEAPASATGEDVLELHLHGGPAVVKAVMNAALALSPELRLAEAGEFTRRALENGKLDLLEVEALGELLAAETRGQLRQAQRQLSGELGRKIRQWRDEIVSLRALMEAHLDFSDEGDVPAAVMAEATGEAARLEADISSTIRQADRGARIRNGVEIVILGPPNAGKSSLMNALCGRDMAIVSSIAGTTRDVVEGAASIGDWPVTFVDTAGLRDSADEIEKEGVRRARTRGAAADLVLVIESPDTEPALVDVDDGQLCLRVATKADLGAGRDGSDCTVSVKTGQGVEALRERIATLLSEQYGSEPALVSRERPVAALRDAVIHLQAAQMARLPELAAEDLRMASRALGRVVGDVDLDSVLDRLFAGFCIGK